MSAGEQIGQPVSKEGFSKPWMKAAIVALIFAVAAPMLGPTIWPPADSGPDPTSMQLVSFIVLAAMTSLTFGLGVSFLVFGLPLVRHFAGSAPRAWAMYLSIGWLLVSWWSHAGLHGHIHDNVQRLLYVEYGFHVPSYLAGLVLAYCFISLGRERRVMAASAG